MRRTRHVEAIRMFALGFIPALILALTTPPASAAWSAPSTMTSGTYAMASIGHRFDLIKAGSLLGSQAGTGGTTFTSTSVSLGDQLYFDLTNTSNVSTNPTGTVGVTLGSGVYAFPAITVKACSGTWDTTLGTCTGTITVLAGPVSGATTPTIDYGTVAPSGVVHIAISTGAVSAGSIILTGNANDGLTRTGIDRSNG